MAALRTIIYGEKFVTVLSLAALAGCFVLGGSSQASAYSQFFVRLVFILIGSAALLAVNKGQLASVRMPLILCGLWTLLMIMQLIPLPPAVWAALPGREQIVGLASLAGIAQPWRPISLVPEATLDSALGMVVPLAMLVTLGQLYSRHFPLLLVSFAILVLLSGLIGVAQVASGGAMTFYKISNRGDAVGLFANRNHQAALLAATVPLLAGLSCLPGRKGTTSRAALLTPIAFILMFPLVFVTGSRSGLALLIVGIVLASFIVLKTRPARVGGGLSREALLLGAAAMAIIVAGAALVVLRIGAVERLLTHSVADDVRVALFGHFVAMAEHYLPMGGGFGAFPSMFMIDEPFSVLDYNYLNHAHDDALEFIIEGGIPALIIAAVFLAWATRASVRLWRAPFHSAHSTTHVTGLVASAMLLILLLASLSDYPLRTPALAGVSALAAALLAKAHQSLLERSNRPPGQGAAGRDKSGRA